MDAKQYLSQIKKQDLIIENCLFEIARYRDIACGLGGGYNDGVKVQGSKDNNTEKNMIMYVDKKEQLVKTIEAASKERLRIIRMIEKLENRDLTILYKRYVQGKLFKEIGFEMGLSQTGITYMHRKALEHFQELIDREKLYG